MGKAPLASRRGHEYNVHMSRPGNVLVAHKRSTLERYRASNDSRLQELVDRGELEIDSLRASHDRHYESLDAVTAELRRQNIDFDLLYRGDVEDTRGYDLVLAVGGDGTVLDLSHKVHDQPLLAVNSDPGLSVGYFCAGTAEEFPELLRKTVESTWEPTRLCRFGVVLDGRRVGSPVLNDVLVCHENPAAVSRYVLRVGEAEDEAQKSSGIWVSTAAGSTAAIRSAGGYVLPLDSRKIQYLVREPCPPTVGFYRHIKGIRDPSQRFEVVSKMPEGRIYLDGPHVGFPFPVGCTLTFDVDVPNLAIFGVADKLRD